MTDQTNKFQLVPYEARLQPAWDSVVREAKNATFLHYRDYMDYHADRFADASVLIYAGAKPVAAFPCNQLEDVIVSHGGLTYGGLLIGTGVYAAEVLEIFEAMAAYFRAAGKSKIVYKAVPSVFHSYPADEDLYALNRVGAKLFRRDLSSVVELATRPKFSDSRKSTARKAQKAGGEVIELNDFSGFHSLLTDVLRKFGANPVHSLAELCLLKSRFPENIRLFGTVIGGQLAAGALVYDCGHIVHTQYLASSDAGRQVGALDFLLLTLIEKYFSDKRYFSFGISTEDSGRLLNVGLISQKEGFGGRGIVHDFYEWVL
jgi:hypothetical protein